MATIGYPRRTAIGRGLLEFEAPGLGRVIPASCTQLTPHEPLSEPLLPSVATGLPGAAERCLDRYGGLVWSLARKYFAEPADAEDAVQEAFVSLWRSAGRFDPEVASETTFVAMIARRRIIDLVRRSRSASPSTEPTGEAIDPAAIADAPSTPGLEILEEVERIRNRMQSLREEERRVLDLAVCQGLSQSRVAEVTGWPLGTVKSHARRGMARLREMLGVTPSAQPAGRKEAAR